MTNPGIRGASSRSPSIPFPIIAALLTLPVAAAALWSDQSRAVVVDCTYAGLLAASLYTLNRREQRFAVFVLSAAFALLIVGLAVWRPQAGGISLGNGATDRQLYSDFYQSPELMATKNIEVGFQWIVSTLGSLMPLEAFLVGVAYLFLFSVWTMTRALKASDVFPVILLVLLAYFAFWSGALNVTRQFLATGLGLVSVACWISGGRARWGSAIWLVAPLIHFSAVIFPIFALVDLLVKRRNGPIIGIWIVNWVLLGLNVWGVLPLYNMAMTVPHLSSYIQTDQVGGPVNRFDFALFLTAPIVLYLFNQRVTRVKIPAETNHAEIERFALFYSVTAIPFFALSFLLFSDRLAYPCFVAAPILVLVLLARSRIKWQQAALYIGLPVIAVVQFAIGLYGYSPREMLVASGLF